MVAIVEIHGYEEFVKYAEAIDPKGPPVFFYFSAEPVVKAFLSELKTDVIFVYVDVGDRETWKDKACSFRTDSRLKLMVIPTIIRWKGVQRLEGSQCNKRELLQMLFEDED